MGMVLSAMPIGEYDKRLVILTREHGKISAFAKGARKQNSALLACSQPFSFGSFHIFVGRNSYTIVSADISNYFSELRGELEAVYYGMYFCEFADYLTRENVEASDMLKLLYQSLRALIKKSIPPLLVRYIFELKMMHLNGEGPSAFGCAIDGNGADEWYFSGSAGGMVCDVCRKNYEDAFPIHPATAYTLQFIAATPTEKLYTFHVSERVMEDLERVTITYLKRYVGISFKSLSMLALVTE